MKKEHTGGLTPIGDLMKADLRFKPPTKTQWRLIEAAAEIGMGEEGLPTYQHTVSLSNLIAVPPHGRARS